MEAQLNIFDQPVQESVYDIREQLLNECYELRGHKEIFTSVPQSIERLTYLCDWMKAWKEGRTERIQALGLQVGGAIDLKTLEIEQTTI